jgi:hypothetical protein
MRTLATVLLICTCLVGPAQVTWQRTYGGGTAQEARAIKALDDGGAVVCGSTGSTGAGDMYVLRLDVSGEIVWSAVIGGPGVEVGRDIVVLPDGRMLAVGFTNSSGQGGYDGLAVMLTADGTVAWERTYGTAEWDFLHAVAPHDEGFLLAGSSYGQGSGTADMWLLGVDMEGNVQWDRSYDGGGQDEANDVLDLGPAGCLIGGTVRTGTPLADAVMVKYAADGSLEWATELGGADEEAGRSVAQTTDGGYVIGGHTRSFGQHTQMFMGRTNDQGEEQWAWNVSGDGDHWEGRALLAFADGTFALAGYTMEHGAGGRDISLLFLDEWGYFMSGPTYGGAGDDEAWAADMAADGAYYVAGTSASFGPGAEAVFVVRSHGDTLNGAVVPVVDPVGVPEVRRPDAIAVHPNPATPGSMVDLRGLPAGGAPFRVAMLDVQGRTVHERPLPGHGPFTLPLVPSGAYTLVLSAATGDRWAARLMVE